MQRHRIWLSSMLVGLLCGAPAFSATRTIGPGDDVQSAVNGMGPGDRLELQGGSYPQQLRISVSGTDWNNAVVIAGAAGATVVFNPSSGSAALFEISGAKYVIIDNIQIEMSQAIPNISITPTIWIDVLIMSWARSPRTQVTVGAPKHVPWLGVEVGTATSLGSVSRTVTPVARFGPLFVTRSV